MDELRTIYMIGNHDSPETFLQEEKELISRGYKPLNPVKIVWEYEKRFGSLSQEDRRTKLLGHLLRSFSFLGRLVLAAYEVCMTGAKNRFYYHGETLIQLGRPPTGGPR